jgi:hypothetical protein
MKRINARRQSILELGWSPYVPFNRTTAEKGGLRASEERYRKELITRIALEAALERGLVNISWVGILMEAFKKNPKGTIDGIIEAIFNTGPNRR